MAKHLMEVGIDGGCLWVFAWSEIKIFGKTLKYHRRKIQITEQMWLLFQEYIDL
jgi:hypothetical protein